MTDYAPPAGLLKRLMALVWWFLVLALWFVSTGIFVLVYPKTGLPMEDINGVTRAAPGYLKGILLPLLLVEAWLFYAWFWMRSGQTLGMRACLLGSSLPRWAGQTVADRRPLSWGVPVLGLFGAGYLVVLIAHQFCMIVVCHRHGGLPKKPKGEIALEQSVTAGKRIVSVPLCSWKGNSFDPAFGAGYPFPPTVPVQYVNVDDFDFELPDGLIARHPP